MSIKQSCVNGMLEAFHLCAMVLVSSAKGSLSQRGRAALARVQSLLPLLLPLPASV